MDKRSKFLVTLATLITNQSYKLYLKVVKTALNNGIKPVEIKENSCKTPAQKLIFDIIGIEPKSFDEIQGLTEMDTESLLMELTMMELEGLIEKTEGDRYKRV